MSRREDQHLSHTLLASARCDGPRPGAKARALSRLGEQAANSWLRPLGAASVVAAALLGATATSGHRGLPTSSNTGPSPVCVAVAVEAPRLAASRPRGSTECGDGVEAPAASCRDVGGGIGCSSGTAGGSSGGASRGSSGSSSG